MSCHLPPVQVLGEYCTLLALSAETAGSLARALQAATSPEREVEALAGAGIKSLRGDDVRSLLARGPFGESIGLSTDGRAP